MNSTATDTDYRFNAYTAQVSYFLTGERKNYRSSGFSRVSPKRDFGTQGGPGAWELAVRYSSNDLNSGSILGGQMSGVTAGLNWYLNPITRIMANYTYADVKDLGNTSIVQMRVQVDF